VFKLKGLRAVALLEAWLVWARRCRIPAFVRLAQSITVTGPGSRPPCSTTSPTASSSPSTPASACSPGSPSASNPEALIGLAMLSVCRLYPPLSNRALPTHG
jgi:transposase